MRPVPGSTPLEDWPGLRAGRRACRNRRRNKKNLPAHAEIGAPGDESGNHIQLLGEWGCRENGLQRRNTRERGSEQIVRSNRSRHRVGIRLFEQIVMRQRQQIAERLQTNVRIRAAIETAQTDAASGRDGVWQHEVTHFEYVGSCDGNGKRDL